MKSDYEVVGSIPTTANHTLLLPLVEIETVTVLNASSCGKGRQATQARNEHGSHNSPFLEIFTGELLFVHLLPCSFSIYIVFLPFCSKKSPRRNR